MSEPTKRSAVVQPEPGPAGAGFLAAGAAVAVGPDHHDERRHSAVDDRSGWQARRLVAAAWIEALAGVAIAHAHARATLAASRARVLAAADASRRQVQRDLHDGAQQRLVHTILDLKLAREAAAGHDCAAAEALDEALHHAEQAEAELHDLVRGVLPASLTLHGLRAALDSLTDHLPLEVTLDVDSRRLPVPVETAAYFVVAEALTNVVKHARIDRATVRAVLGEDGALRLEISDEGAGGADAGSGTGLRGLADRVEAGGGSFEFDSPPGGGTRIRASIPVTPA